MKVMAVLIASVLLAACASSMQEMKDRGPVESFSTTKASQGVGECILFAWQNQAIAGVHDAVVIQPRQGGGQSVVNDSLREVADVYKSGETTKVDFFTNGGGRSWVSEKRLTALRTCL
ncbi:hypothetical protein [Pseudomonas bohemica]|uniref:hypothetical protein n=1 Tax=Pseudomonas bohemica TaxID=2044872 RepID=UPI000DA613F0|nr:hypothetical protein [Pseudomonas bohemica]